MANVLIVDDSKVLRMAQRAILEKLGHEVIGEAANGQEGCERYFERRPDVMMIDLAMPVMDGIATIEHIKAHDKDAKILLLTSNANAEKIDEALAKGAAEVLLKPLEEALLEDALSRLLETG